MDDLRNFPYQLTLDNLYEKCHPNTLTWFRLIHLPLSEREAWIKDNDRKEMDNTKDMKLSLDEMGKTIWLYIMANYKPYVKTYFCGKSKSKKMFFFKN